MCLFTIMSEDTHKIRYCAVTNCHIRMSAIVKDPHVLCPVHTGFQCDQDKRCDICKTWSEQQMLDYIKLQEGKARRKAHKDRKRAMKLEAKYAHELSPTSSSSIGSSGETVSFPLVPKDSVRTDIIGEGNFKLDSSVSADFVAPSAVSLPGRIDDSGYVGHSSAVPHRIQSLAAQGNEDPEPLKVLGENPSCVGQPPLKMTDEEIGQEYTTPSTSVGSGRSRSNFILTPTVYNTMKGVLDEHKEASDKEKMRLMLDALMDVDPSFSGRSSSSGKSRKSRSSVRTQRSSSSVRRHKSTVDATHSSVIRGGKEQLEVAPVVIQPKLKTTKQAPQVELSREWARMVQTGGVKVISGASCYFKDKDGKFEFVHPPTESSLREGSLGQKFGRLALCRTLRPKRTSPQGLRNQFLNLRGRKEGRVRPVAIA